jgi:hypothetical protein
VRENWLLYLLGLCTPNKALTEEEVFSSAFEPNPLTLQPHRSNSSFLTVNLAEDVPLGAYVFYVELGNSQETHVEKTSFTVDVNPK